MAFLVTRGLGRSTIGQDTTFVATSGLGRGIQIITDKVKAATHDRFNDLRDYVEQAKREDEDLLVICQTFIKMICR